jgi:putative glycosyl hydrolase-like family 15 (GHL15) protein
MDRRTFLKVSGAGTGALTLASAGVLSSTDLAAAATIPATEAPVIYRGHWDTVPLYGHLGKPTGAFTDAEVRFLVNHYPIITLEKTMGMAKTANADAAAEMAYRQIKAKSAKTKVFYYFNSAIDWVPLYPSTINGLPAGYTLTLPDGSPYVPSADPTVPGYKSVRAFDLSNPDLRDWWVTQVVRQIREVGYDGVFVDGIKFNTEGRAQLAAAVGVAKQQAVTAGLGTMLTELRNQLPACTTVLYNGIATNAAWNGGLEYLDRSDAVMLEEFGQGDEETPTLMAGDMDLVTEVGARGKIAVFCGAPNSGNPNPVPSLADGISFPLACFLCCTGPTAGYFRYGDGWYAQDGPLMTFPILNRRLGPPEGPATRNGYLYERTFQHARVTADLTSATGTIEFD